MDKIIDVRGLVKSFPVNRKDRERVLGGIDFSVREGEFVSIVGPSGSGKSTFLYCISGLDPADSGVCRLCGVDVVTASREARSRVRRKNASFVFQDYNLVDSMTALENVALGLRFSGKKLDKGALRGLFERFGIADKRGHYPAQLSGGQRQRVALIRALAVRPRVLFADEPTGALDSASSALVIDELAALGRQGTTVVMVTHDLEVASRAQRAVVFADGAIARSIESPSSAVLFAEIERLGAM